MLLETLLYLSLPVLNVIEIFRCTCGDRKSISLPARIMQSFGSYYRAQFKGGKFNSRQPCWKAETMKLFCVKIDFISQSLAAVKILYGVTRIKPVLKLVSPMAHGILTAFHIYLI